MADDRKLPTRYTPGSLPTLGIPNATPRLSSALVQHVKNRVADMMYGRLNSVAEKRVQLERHANDLVGLATDRERLLGVWDDLDNILDEDQKARDGDRARNQFHRSKSEIDNQYDLEVARIAAMSRLASAQAEHEQLHDRLAPKKPAATPAPPADTSGVSPALQRAMLVKKMHHDFAAMRHSFGADLSIAPNELASAIAQGEAAIRQWYVDNHGFAAAPDDDANFNLAR
ncbi:MAG: hypothetical protein ABL907_16090 [Hyphomicrobium sp.]